MVADFCRLLKPINVLFLFLFLFCLFLKDRIGVSALLLAQGEPTLACHYLVGCWS